MATKKRLRIAKKSEVSDRDANQRRVNWKTLLEIFTFLIGLSGIIVGYISYKSNEEIARKSGNFDRANIQIGIADILLSDYTSDTTTLIFYRKDDEHSLNVCNLPMRISNIGRKTAENVKVLIEFPKVASLAVMDTQSISLAGPDISTFSRSISSNANSNLIMLRIGEINPGVNINIDEPINFHSTEVHTTVEFNDTLSFDVSARFALAFNLSITAKDIPSKRRNFLFTTTLDTSIKNIVSSFVEKMTRIKNGQKSAFIFFPRVLDTFAVDTLHLNQFNICKTCYCLITIKDTSPEQDMLVAVYNDEELTRIFVYDENNKFKHEIFLNN